MKPTYKLLIAALFITATFMFYNCTKSAKALPGGQGLAQSSAVAQSRCVINSGSRSLINSCGLVQEEPLTAGQTILMGKLSIENDETNLYVTYSTYDGWSIKELHLSVDCNNGGDCTQSKSNDLAPGKFPYSQVYSSPLPTSCTFIIPRSSLGSCSCFCIYPHAVVTNSTYGTQTAWGGTVKKIINGKWYGGTSYCYQACVPKSDEQLKTLTQDEWAAAPNGTNAGTYLDTNFSSAFFNGLTIGIPNQGNYLTLTSANAVRNFLPQTGSPTFLAGAYIDPAGQYSSLWGQLITAELNMGFDSYDPNFAASSLYQLADAKFATGVFAGKSVQDVILLANTILSTGDTSVYSLNDLEVALTIINNNYRDGIIDNGNLMPYYIGK